MSARLFIRELERVLQDDGIVNARPLVRKWLGEDAVLAAGDPIEGCDWTVPQCLHHHLADPEAAGWALAAARHLYAYDFAEAIELLRRTSEEDEKVAGDYVGRVFARVGGGEA